MAKGPGTSGRGAEIDKELRQRGWAGGGGGAGNCRWLGKEDASPWCGENGPRHFEDPECWRGEAEVNWDYVKR